MLAAYADARYAATTRAVLTPDLTARWNGMLRGIPAAGFREGPAFAKNGRDRYGLHADTQQRYASCLVEAADQMVPVAARAARAYLDVAFFHPYEDGNARLGGLVLHFVLLRAGVELDEVRPALTTIRRADDPEGAAGLARLVHGTAMATNRRWLRSPVFITPDPVETPPPAAPAEPGLKPSQPRSLRHNDQISIAADARIGTRSLNAADSRTSRWPKHATMVQPWLRMN
ncbi:hypothetical protein Areg01_89080 [Actinoplanes regularis]|nr:hypothetical protein Areg01_89080 [Actinoplanes regularis]